MRFIADHGRIHAEAALAGRRIAQPAQRFFERLQVVDARQDDALRARIEQAREERIQQLAHAHQRRYARVQRGVDHVLHGLQVEGAVFHIDKDIIESGGRESARDFGRPVCLQHAAEHSAALGETFTGEVDLHSAPWVANLYATSRSVLICRHLPMTVR